MLIKEFAQYLDKLEKTVSRNEMTQILADLFKKLKPKEGRMAVYLALGMLAPSYQEKEFQMGEKLIIRAISRAFNVDEKKVVQEYKKLGDLGDLSLLLRSSISFKNLTSLNIKEVYNQLMEIAEIAGQGSVEKKINTFAQLLQALDPLSAKFITRIPIGALRLGFSDATILDALSVMRVNDKSLRKKIERAYNVSADIGLIVEKFIENGIDGLKKINVTVGIPVRMAGAERLPNAQKIIEKLGRCAVEPKYDGFRVQIHQKKINNEQLTQVKIYSRNLENVETMFPDIADATKRLIKHDIIFEGEAISYNPDSGEFLPFQETMQRKRKYDINLFSKDIPLRVFVYDLLYLDGQNIFELPYEKRRAIMEKIFSKDKNSEIVLTPMNIIADAKTLEKKFDECVAEGLEGVVVKKLDAPYQAGARGFFWVKFKRAMRGELADTIDCLVMGYYVGKGKRSDFGIGAILVGVYDEKDGIFKTVAKIGTGFTDQEWRQMKKRIDAIKIKDIPKNYQIAKELIPDILAKPQIVIEVQADEITKSPLHLAAKDYFKEAGLALRFPRMVRWRDEKKPEQATSVKELLKLYRMQNV